MAQPSKFRACVYVHARAFHFRHNESQSEVTRLLTLAAHAQRGLLADRIPWPNPSLSGAHAYRRDQRGMLAQPRPDPLALCTFEAQEATAKGVYRLPHAIYYRS